MFSPKLKLLILLNISCNLHAMDISQKLTRAIWQGNIQEARALISAGAYVDVQDQYQYSGHTLLTWSARQGYKDIVRLLLSHGANSSVQNKWGHTALMEAANWNHEDIVEILLKAKADVNAQAYGDSALRFAVMHCYTDVVVLLLKAGADITVKDISGKTVLDIVREMATQNLNTKRYRKIEALLMIAVSARKKLYKLREQAARKYAEQYSGIPAQEIIKYLK